MRIRTVLVLALCGAPAHAADRSPLASGDTLRVAVIRGDRVQAVRDITGEGFRGIAVDLASRLAQQEGLRWSVVAMGSARAVENAVARGEADLGFVSGEAPTGDGVRRSRPYLQVGQTVVVRADSTLRDVGDLDRPGLKIAVGGADGAGGRLRTRFGSAVLVEASDLSVVEVRDKLKSGEIDAYAGDRQRLSQAMHGMAEFRLLAEDLAQTPQTVIVAPDRPAALERVEPFLAEAKRSGLLRDAIRRNGLVGVAVAE